MIQRPNRGHVADLATQSGHTQQDMVFLRPCSARMAEYHKIKPEGGLIFARRYGPNGD